MDLELADRWIPDRIGDFFQIAKPIHLHIQSRRKGEFSCIAHDVAIILVEHRHGQIDDRGINQHAIAGDLHHKIGAHLAVRLDHALQYIVFAPTMYDDLLRLRPALERVVSSRHRGRQHDPI